MADLPELNEWVPGIYQLETSDPVLGGPEGIDNKQAKQLANRTKWLKDQIQKIVDGATSIGKALQLETPRTLRFKGAATGSGTYDGSEDTEIQLTLADSGIAPGSYTKVTFNGKGVATGGSNPTSLAEYGITDALSTQGGDVNGEISLVGGRSFNVMASDAESWAGGVMAKTRNSRNIIGGVGTWGNADSARCAFMGLGATPWASGNGVRVTSSGVDITGPISGNGVGLTGLKWNAIGGLPNSLAGYGVPFASQQEAETGADTNKPMSALRVWQAIAAKVVQATESVLGLLRVATLTEVINGSSDTTVITPKKLLFGFVILIGPQGYICFPAFFKSLIIQWGTGGAIAAGASVEVSYPVSYPNAHLMTIVGNSYSSGNTSGSASLGVAYINESKFKISAVGSQGQPNSPWISIGY